MVATQPAVSGEGQEDSASSAASQAPGLPLKHRRGVGIPAERKCLPGEADRSRASMSANRAQPALQTAHLPGAPNTSSGITHTCPEADP